MRVTPSLFPASPLEQAIGYLDSPAEPWTVGLALTLRGPVEVEALAGAVADAVARHPLLRARETVDAPAGDGRWRPWWRVLPPGPVPFETALAPGPGEGDARLDAFLSRPFDLRDSVPVRALWVGGMGAGKLVLSVAHRACDGVGAARLAEHVLAAYAARVEGRPPDRREEPVGRAVREPVTLDRPLAGLRRSGGWAGRVAGPAVPACSDGGVPHAAGHVTASAWLGLEEVSALAGRWHATVNDVLVAALHRVLGAWQVEHGRPDGVVRTVLPVNLRPDGGRQAGACNGIGLIQAATAPGDRATLAGAVRAVAAQTGRRKRDGSALGIHRWLLPLTLVSRRAADLAAPLGQAVAGRWVGTAMLSNLGLLAWPLDLVHAGGATVTGAAMYPPTWRPMRVAVGALGLWGRLHLTVRLPRAHFSPAAAEALLARLRAELPA